MYWFNLIQTQNEGRAITLVDFSSLLDMSYFWWVFNKIIPLGMVFLVIYIAIKAGGLLLSTLVQAFRKMGK